MLGEKVKTPSLAITISSLVECEKGINSLIDKANDKIKIYNEKIDNIKENLQLIKIKFWKLMKKQYMPVFTLYESAKKTYLSTEQDLKKQSEQISKNIDSQQVIITQKQKETVNIDEAVDNIKNGLIDIGITDFTIEKYSEENALYRLKREGSDVLIMQSRLQKKIIVIR